MQNHRSPIIVTSPHFVIYKTSMRAGPNRVALTTSVMLLKELGSPLTMVAMVKPNILFAVKGKLAENETVPSLLTVAPVMGSTTGTFCWLMNAMLRPCQLLAYWPY